MISAFVLATNVTKRRLHPRRRPKIDRSSIGVQRTSPSYKVVSPKEQPRSFSGIYSLNETGYIRQA